MAPSILPRVAFLQLDIDRLVLQRHLLVVDIEDGLHASAQHHHADEEL